jgi:hypothetical protein
MSCPISLGLAMPFKNILFCLIIFTKCRLYTANHNSIICFVLLRIIPYRNISFIVTHLTICRTIFGLQRHLRPSDVIFIKKQQLR